jgi:hypothetical protein
MSFQLFSIKSTHLVVNTDQIISVSVDLQTNSTVILCREGNKYLVDDEIGKVLKQLGIRVPGSDRSHTDISGFGRNHP